MGRSQGKIAKKTTSTRATKAPSKTLIPRGDKYMQDGTSLLLIGLHGTGKTESVMQLAKKAGLKLKIFNCATLDPYTDLIGVPVPVTNQDGTKELQMVRPPYLDEAEVIFFDELNRAPVATRNAVFEIVQFGSIHGEKLANLRCCWAAMNPPDEDYEVEDIDQALIDRFDIYKNFNPKVSVQYMSQYMKKTTAQALQAWWGDHNNSKRDSYISPRRLMKLGILYEKYGSAEVRKALPPGGTYDSKKLITMLQAADRGKLASVAKKKPKGIKSQAPIEDLIVNKKTILKNSDRIIKHLKKDPKDVNTQKKIVDSLKTGVGVEKLFSDYGDILNNLSENQIEAVFAGMSKTKKSQIRSHTWNLTYSSRSSFNLRGKRRLFKVLKGLGMMYGH